MGKAQREKGAAGELANALFDELGVKLARRLDQARGGGFDLVTIPDQGGPMAAGRGRACG